MNQDPAITIQPGEVVRFSDQFSPNMILTHLKVSVVLTDQRVIVRRPNTLFGIIPKGYSESSSPLRHISQVSAGEFFSSRFLIYAAVLILTGLSALFGGAVISGGIGVVIGLIFIGLGVFFFMKAHTIGIAFRNHGAGVLSAEASKTERARVEIAKQAINSLLFGFGQPPEPLPDDPAPDVIAPPNPLPPNPVGSGRFSAAQASDPATSQAILSQIAEHEPALRALVAVNPNAYPGLLDWLRTLGDEEVDRALSTRV